MKTNNIAIKRNLSSIQVLKTLQILMQGEYTMNEIINKLNEKEKTPVFNNSVVSKYINSCRYCGINIPKIHNKYKVASLPFGLDISETDSELFKILQSAVQEKMSSRTNKEFVKLLNKIEKYSNKQIVKVESNIKNLTGEIFEKAIRAENKIRLIFKSNNDITCIPLKIVEHDGKCFFNVFYDDKEHLVNIDRVASLEILSERFKHTYNDTTVIFKLKGDLAKNYELREHETIISKNKDGEIVIANRGEYKEILFPRLLRYQNLCEIEHPKSYREEMKFLLDKTLENYGV